MALHGGIYRKLAMAFNTNKIIVTKNKLINSNSHEFYNKFEKIQDVPGYEQLLKENHINVIEFIQNNIHDTSLCLQAVKYKSHEILIHNVNGDLESAAGWQIRSLLGQGKDGITFLGYQHNDETREIKTVKCLSKYGQQYANHTRIFSELFALNKENNNNFFKIFVSDYYTCYSNSDPLNEVSDKKFNQVISTLARMNSWSIKNTGFAFWDFGFTSGRNYMLDADGVIKWIDYGGAGLVRCPNFDYVYEKNSSQLPPIELTKPFLGKGSLVIANSDFLMCQYLLHIEYWKNKNSTNTDIWSSMLQIRPGVVNEFIEFLPSLLSTDITRMLYHTFKTHDWSDSITWKQVGKYIDANT